MQWPLIWNKSTRTVNSVFWPPTPRDYKWKSFIRSTLVYCINYLNWNFQPASLNLISFAKKIQSSVEDELSTPRNMQAGAPQGSVLSPTLYRVRQANPLYNLYSYIRWQPPNNLCLPSSFCWWRLSVCDRTQGRLCSVDAGIHAGT
jgi:hypothetical protein